MESSDWTGLEIIKLVVSILTPIAVVVLGYIIARATGRLEAAQWVNQTVIQRRLELFCEVAPKLNKMLCFVLFIGTWKELTPATVIKLKRETDEVVFVNRFLFSPELLKAYEGYINLLFAHFSRTDGDAPIRANISEPRGDRRKLPWWNESMLDYFATEDIPTGDEVTRAYDRLSEAFRLDLHVGHEHPTPGSGR